MTLQIEWTLDARADFARIDEFYADKDMDYADRVGDAAMATGSFLQETPGAGARIGDSDIRKFNVKSTPFILIYRVLPDRVQILRVRHAREDWKPFE